MLSSENITWNENTEIREIIPMYDQSQEMVNAYSVELTAGYIIVSAYMDVKDVVLEWSDEFLPIYSEFQTNSNSKIIYLGNYEYYLASADGVVIDVYGDTVEDSDLTNSLSQTRDIENLPIEVLNYCSVSPQYTPNEWIADPSLYPIIDPFSHATNYFGRGTFKCSDFCNIWDSYIECFTYGDNYHGYNNWAGSCGPTAITNMILAYNNRYPGKINITSPTSVMDTVCTYGVNNNYYTASDDIYGGTKNDTAAKYILNSLRLYNIPTNVVGNYDITYENVKTYLKGDDLLYMVVFNDTYKYHFVFFHFTDAPVRQAMLTHP